MRKSNYLVLLTLLVGVVSAMPVVFAEEENEVAPFIFGVSSNPSSFDPLGAYDTTSGNVILNTLEGLYAFDYTAENGIAVVPQLAASMGTWNTEKTELTIDLRDDVTWWDGSAFTADDVVWNFERLNTLSDAGVNQHASLWFTGEDLTLASIEASGVYQVTMTLNTFSGAWEKLLPFWGASLIKPITGLNETLTLEEMDQVIGTGPFMLEEYVAGETTTLVRYEDYYGGAADIEQLEFQFFADAAALTDALLGKEIHVVRSIVDTQRDAAEADPDIHTEILYGDCVYFYHMNIDNIPWAVRKAAQFSFNYSYIPTLSVTLPSTTHPIPKGMEGYNPDLPGLPYFDLTKAKQYLLDADGTDGIDTGDLTIDSPDADWVARADSDNPVWEGNFTHYGTSFYSFLANFLRTVGINLVDDTVGDWPTFLAWTSDPDNMAIMQFSMGGWCPDYFDPYNMLAPLFDSDGSSNWNGLRNSTIDSNLDEMNTLPDGSDAKLDMVDTVVTQVIVEQAAAMYTVASADLIAWNQNRRTGITGGSDVLLNSRGDKYFYPIKFAGNNEGIPGYPLGIMIVGLLGVTGILVFKKRK